MELTVQDLMDMAADLLDVIPDGWNRTVFRDVCKLAEETGEVAEAVVKTSKTDKDLADELADVIVVCCVIALRKKIDLNEACIDKHKERIQKRLSFYRDGEVPEGWSPRIKY